MTNDNLAPKGWKQLDDFREGLTINLQPTTHELDGEYFTFLFDRLTISLQMVTDESCEVDFNGEKRLAGLTVFSVAEDTYMLGCEFLNPENEGMVIIFNVKTSRVLLIHSIARVTPIPGEERVIHNYHVGTIDGILPSGFVPERTNDLTGQRLLISYGPDHEYEQIFINSHRYCWHCLKGEQYGDAASERCVYYKFAENMYMYSWHEMLIPCGTAYFLNYETNVATGKFIGWDSNNEISHSYGGGIMKILSVTEFPENATPYSAFD